MSWISCRDCDALIRTKRLAEREKPCLIVANRFQTYGKFGYRHLSALRSFIFLIESGAGGVDRAREGALRLASSIPVRDSDTERTCMATSPRLTTSGVSRKAANGGQFKTGQRM